MDSPIIGITTDFAPEEPGRDPRFFLKSSYVLFFQSAGARVVLLPSAPPIFSSDWSLLDGIILSGSGTDIPPNYYGEEKTYLPGQWMSDERVALEFSLLETSERMGIPIFGICGGFQTMNVYRGGTLIQDLPSMRPDGLLHQNADHGVALGRSFSILAENSGIETERAVRVNSFHHQGVNRLGNRLEIEAISEDRLIEGFNDPNHPCFIGVQWHPERMPTGDPFSKALRDTFLEACRTYRMMGRR